MNSVVRTFRTFRTVTTNGLLVYCRGIHSSKTLMKQLSQKDSEPSSEKLSSLISEHQKNTASQNPLSATKDKDGLQVFLGTVVKHMAGGLAVTSAVVAGSMMLLGHGDVITETAFFCTGAIGLLGSAFAMDRIKPCYEVDHRAGGVRRVITNPTRITAFLTMSVSMGLCVAPVIAMCDPIIVLASACLSGGMMAGMAHYALTTPKTMMNWGPALYIGLWTLIGNGVVSLFLGVPSPMFWLDIIGGTGLFMGITAYDTQRAIEEYNNGNPDHLGHAAHFYLDFMNIFIRVLDALAKAQQNK